ncbi:hypothetical protein ACO0RG_000755 [Hanseniaspora osmophila]
MATMETSESQLSQNLTQRSTELAEPSQYINDFAVWTADDLATHCLNCNTRFTFINRKHHCRCCGGIFCSNCSDYFLWYNEDKVKVVEYTPRHKNIFLANPLSYSVEENAVNRMALPPYRTCVSCYTDLRRSKLLLSYSQYCNRGFLSKVQTTKHDKKDHDSDQKNGSVVLEEEATEEEQESLASSTTPQPAVSGRCENLDSREQQRGEESDLERAGHTSLQDITSGTKNSTNSAHMKAPLKAPKKSRHSSAANEYLRCPICNHDLKALSQKSSEDHINECLQRAEFNYQHTLQNTGNKESAHYNRMLVYTVKPRSNSTNTFVVTEDRSFDDEQGEEYPECPICFEEMLPGQKVGRLECICVYHYHCIKEWFAKKRSQNKDASKNWCPFHDALS